MALEKRWNAVPAVLLTANGGSDGKVTVSSTSGFKVKQLVNLKSTLPSSLEFRVQKVESETVLYLGPKDGKIHSRSNLSAFTTALSSTIEAVEQLRPSIPQLEYERAVYEEEPTIAKRVFLVDEFGDGIDGNNPLPVEAVISDNAPQNRIAYRNTYPSSNVEASQLLPDNTKKLYISVADKKAKLKVSFEEDGTIDIGENTYTTVDLGNCYFREGLRLIGKTLYYQANRDNLVIEIEAWV